MYIPKSFVNNTIHELQDFIEHYNFATVISYHNQHFQISHIPLILKRDLGPNGTLVGHFAKLNPHAQQIENHNNHTICIFHGPHAYISPTWYKAQPSVPTWNYAVVHAHGKLKPISQEELSLDVTKMVNIHETNINPSDNYNIPADYQEKLIEHIVGFHIEIESFEGKYKLGQNRSAEDQAGMLVGLRNEKSYGSQMLADFIESLNKTK